MPTSNGERKRSSIQVVLSERFDSVLYPIEIIDLFDRLPEFGWVVSRRMDEQGTLRLRDAPSKGNVRLVIDTANKTLGVSGNDLTETLNEYRGLRSLIRELIEFPPQVVTDYVEFRYTGSISGETNPPQVFSAWWGEYDRAINLGEFLGERLPSDAGPLSPYGIRFAPSGIDANRPNWTEFSITPSNIAGHKYYLFDLLFRHEDAALAERVAESADEILDSALARLENPDGN